MRTRAMKTIKIGEDAYTGLTRVAGKLQMRLGRPVSLNEALRYLLSLSRKGDRITDLAGSWEMSDEEWDEIRSLLSEAWRRWRPSGIGS
ncbi:hypothetical protein KEJ49_02350 [Candidatus Bathyarchaeota archaeon]|nr:hypothetical protein [Candidatus Bathyarchaeota archaeon]